MSFAQLFWICFGLFAVVAIINCLPTPPSWWKWRVVKFGGHYRLQAIGILKPWWHYGLDLDGCPCEFSSKEEALKRLTQFTPEVV